uniref:Homeobox domain-containing protein n=1 Tax=Kalanchoe fedtschenkoi TaxID=63787 RepID=A0A7N1A0A3_KALFE
MGGVTPTTSTCLDLTISVPGSSSARDVNMKPLRLLSKRSEPDDNWINLGYPKTSEDAEDNDTDSPNEDQGRGGGGGRWDRNPPPRKKLRLSKEQSRLLEESFRQNHTLNPKQKEELADRLKLRPRQVEVWFQNRRARSKLKQTEIECEYLKRWFGSLTEQNQKLQKEVEELRAMKVGPPSVLSARSCEPTLASSLTMCPRCERVSSNTARVEKPATGPTSTAAMSDKVAALQQFRQPSAAF